MILAVVESSIVLVAALAASMLLRRQSAALRHFVLTAGLVGSLLVPFLPDLLPDVPLLDDVEVEALVLDRVEVVTIAARSEPPPAAVTPIPARTPANRGAVLFWIWGTGAAIAAVLLVAAAARIALVGRRCKAFVDERWQRAFRDIIQRMRLTRRVRLLQNREFVLGTWGALFPSVFVPADASGWSDDRIRFVLTHELAHIKRHDWAVQVLSECARAIYWFNPLFWLVCRRLRAESEHACDDVVLNAGFDAKEYAAQLLELARASTNSVRAWPAVLAMSRPPHLERRFIAMLNPQLNHRPLGRFATLLTCAAAICITTAVAAALTVSAAPLPAAVPIAVSPVAEQIAPRPVTKALPVKPAPRPVGKAAATPAPVAAPQGRADGGLAGTVSDPSGAVVPGVLVTALALEKVENGIRENPAAGAISDAAGRFAFNALVPGQYALKAELPGFVTFRKTGIQILPSVTLRENVYLALGHIVQTVEVTAPGQPRPPAPTAGPQRIRVGGSVAAANLISQVKPAYPQSARDAGIEGDVRLQGIIGTDGTFIMLRVVRGNPDLAAAAYEAARQWRYRPAMLNGEPIEVQTEIEMTFRLAQ